MPVDNAPRLWVSARNVDMDAHRSHLVSAVSRPFVDSQLDTPVLGLLAPTLSSEGHPRGNGDGPLTRITRLDRGRGHGKHGT